MIAIRHPLGLTENWDQRHPPQMNVHILQIGRLQILRGRLFYKKRVNPIAQRHPCFDSISQQFWHIFQPLGNIIAHLLPHTPNLSTRQIHLRRRGNHRTKKTIHLKPPPFVGLRNISVHNFLPALKRQMQFTRIFIHRHHPIPRQRHPIRQQFGQPLLHKSIPRNFMPRRLH